MFTFSQIKPSLFIISSKFKENDWFYEQTINKIYETNGISGIYSFLWDKQFYYLSWI